MERNRDMTQLLDLIPDPAFTVVDDKIHTLNPAARGLLPDPGTPVKELICSGADEYADFQEGCLYLTLNIHGVSRGAFLRKIGDAVVFTLEREESRDTLNALALAARELRAPLSNVMLAAQRMFPSCPGGDAAQVNRELYQMLRILKNMADASGYAASSTQETVNIGAVLDEIFQKAAVLLEQAGIHLTWHPLSETIFCLADSRQLERCVLNILSNAAKFTPAGGAVDAALTRRGRMLHLCIQDSGSGIGEGQLSSIFTRYLRQPAIEDGRCGIGLGMVLIRCTAKHHGGAVLIDQPQGSGTRLTLTLAIRQNEGGNLRSPILRVDTNGGMDSALIELSETLPSKLYTP